MFLSYSLKYQSSELFHISKSRASFIFSNLILSLVIYILYISNTHTCVSIYVCIYIYTFNIYIFNLTCTLCWTYRIQCNFDIANNNALTIPSTLRIVWKFALLSNWKYIMPQFCGCPQKIWDTSYYVLIKKNTLFKGKV